MTTEEILAAFPKVSALVLGDICLDRWSNCAPPTSERSRETGIPRIGSIRTEVTPGAGGNLVATATIMKKGNGTASPEEVLAAEAQALDRGLASVS